MSAIFATAPKCREDIVAKWGEFHYRQYFLKDHQERLVEREDYRQQWEAKNAEEQERLLQGRLAVSVGFATETYDMFAAKNLDTAEHIHRGRLQPSNRMSRKIFQELTGLKLPRTVKGTMAVAQEWLGDLWTEFERRRQEDNEREERERQEKIEQRRQTEIAGIKAKIIAREPLNGLELVRACEAYGIEIPLRTKGSFMNRVYDIEKNTFRYRGRKGGGNYQLGPHHYLAQVRHLLTDAGAYEKEKESRERKAAEQKRREADPVYQLEQELVKINKQMAREKQMNRKMELIIQKQKLEVQINKIKSKRKD